MCKLVSTKDSYELETCNVYRYRLKTLVQHAKSCRNVQGSDDVLGEAVVDLLKTMEVMSPSFRGTITSLMRANTKPK